MMAVREHGPEGLGRMLFRQTWPMIFGVLALLGFQLVDAAFITRLGVDPLAALGFTVPVMQLVIGVQVGIGIATTALIARARGAGETLRANRLGGLVVVAGAVVVALLCLALWFGRAPLLRALGADPALLPLVTRYWLAWLPSAWLGAVLYFGYSVCRAHGSMRLPGLVMVGTSVVNLVLDPLFIFTFGWGLPGAALATVVAFGCGIAVVYPQLRQRGWLRFDLAELPPLAGLRGLAGIAGPAMVSQLLPPLSGALATALAAGFGSAAVGAWGFGMRVEFFSIVAVLGLTMSLPPLVSHYLGAGDLATVRALVRLALRFVLAWQLAMAVIWLLAGGPMAALLADAGAVRGLLQDYLGLVPLSYPGLGVCILLVSVCNALGMPARALVISALRLFACYLPALWLGSRLLGVQGLFLGAVAGNLAAGLVAWHLYRAGLGRAHGEPRPAR